MTFIDELRSIPLESQTNAEVMLRKIKSIITDKVRHGATGEISGSVVIGYINPKSEDATEYQEKWEKRAISIFQKNWFTVHFEYSIKPYILEAMPYLKEYARKEEIWVSDPYIVIEDRSNVVKDRTHGKVKTITVRSSHVKYDSIGFRGLDGREEYVYWSACIDYRIRI